ncbi:MAG: hypothetical protein Q8O56_01770, partial [Solirubrobacteraceae bacterium]|nr:hypothetical protein [Solirubrobacteraceae bacterium]
MDDRLQSLQRELESVTASAARQPSEGWRPPPPTVAPAPPPIPPAIARSAHVSRISGSRTTIPESGAPDDSPVRALAPKAAGASAVTLPAARKRRPPAAGRTQTAPDDDAPPRERVAAGAEAVASQTILEAEQEARSVVDEALRRVTEIGVRTRALLEQPGTAPEPAAARTPPRSRGRARTPATRTAPAAR